MNLTLNYILFQIQEPTIFDDFILGATTIVYIVCVRVIEKKIMQSISIYPSSEMCLLHA